MKGLTIAVLIIGIGFLGGYFLPRLFTPDSQLPPLQHAAVTSAEKENGHMHDHKIELPEGEPIPTVDLTVQKDPGSEWSFHFVTENFTFKPDCRPHGMPHVPGEGHVHLYTKGKVFKLLCTDSWNLTDFHRARLGLGTHEIEVRLATNAHDEIMLHGEFITDTGIIKIGN